MISEQPTPRCSYPDCGSGFACVLNGHPVEPVGTLTVEPGIGQDIVNWIVIPGAGRIATSMKPGEYLIVPVEGSNDGE